MTLATVYHPDLNVTILVAPASTSVWQLAGWDVLDPGDPLDELGPLAALDARLDALEATGGAQTGDVTGVARFANKLQNGQNVRIYFEGDSILEGTTVTVPGTDDAASLICAQLAARFGVTVTKDNKANSGDRAYRALQPTRLASGLASQPDLVVIGFGHNDLRSFTQAPGTGYPLAECVGAIEHMVRRSLRAGADVILLTENPYSVGSGSNATLELLNAELRDLAATYRVGLADGYEAFTVLGNWDPYLFDGGHPNSIGHAVLAQTILDMLPPTVGPITTARPALPDHQTATAAHYGRANWSSVSTAIGAIGANDWTTSGTWTGTPPVSSTAGSYSRHVFIGTECALRLDCGAGTGVVDIYVDGVLVHNDLDLTTYSAGQRYLPLVGLHAGTHVVAVVVVSGTITVRGFEAMVPNSEPITMIDPRVVETTGTYTLTATDTSSSWFGTNRKQPGSPSNVLTVSFVGTGLAVESGLSSSAIATRTITATIDGVPYTVDWANRPGGSYGYGGMLFTDALEYGPHTAVITFGASTTTPTLGGFVALGARSTP